MFKTQSNSKSPLTLLFLIAFLVISTLVMFSNYFFRPGLELDLRKKIISTLYSHNVANAVIKVEGRDVILNGIATNSTEAKQIETEIQNISGVHHLESKLRIENHLEQN